MRGRLRQNWLQHAQIYFSFQEDTQTIDSLPNQSCRIGAHFAPEANERLKHNSSQITPELAASCKRVAKAFGEHRSLQNKWAIKKCSGTEASSDRTVRESTKKRTGLEKLLKKERQQEKNHAKGGMDDKSNLDAKKHEKRRLKRCLTFCKTLHDKNIVT